MREADLVVVGPSNPVLSIDPITALLRPHMDPRKTVAVSPVVGGRSLKGPTVDMMAQLGEEPSALGVARHYAGIAATFVLDRVDSALANDVARLGMRPEVSRTVMADRDGERQLAGAILDLVGAS